MPTRSHPIERVALVHVLAGTANEDLSISRNKLNHSAEIASGLPGLILDYIMGRLGGFLFFGLFLGGSLDLLPKGFGLLF